MGKIVKGIVLGAVVGAGIRAAQDLRSTEDDLGAIAPRVAKTAGEAALAGATVGVLLTVRDRRRMKKIAKSAKGVAKLRTLAETGIQVAVPAIQHAVGEARPHVIHALEEAVERAEELRDAAAPHVKKARKEARKRYEQEMKRARPKMEKAAKDAREKVADVADLAAERAKRKLADLDLPTTVIAV
jgi:vacuolar-type H+-ATPase subunit H